MIDYLMIPALAGVGFECFLSKIVLDYTDFTDFLASEGTPCYMPKELLSGINSGHRELDGLVFLAGFAY